MRTYNKLPKHLDLPESELHVWNISLPAAADVRQFLAGFLDENETLKASRFRFEQDQWQYISAHGALRQILSRYIDCNPGAVTFDHNHHGKPYLSPNPENIEFNLSHSKSKALLAVVKDRRTGIDIEHIRFDFDVCGLARQYFSACEVDAMLNLDKRFQTKAFFDCWTRKEAFIKAIGKGLSYPLKTFDVSVNAQESPSIRIDDPVLKEKNWYILDLSTDDYSATVVAESGPIELKLREWDFFE